MKKQMSEAAFRRELTELFPEVPQALHQQVEVFLQEKVEREEQVGEHPRSMGRACGRIGMRALVFALMAVLALSAVALAATQWGIFDALRVILGTQPPTADSVMHANLYQETVNGVTITVQEAGWDGKTLFVQYSYRLPEGVETSARLDEATWALLDEYNVGNWVDAFWIDGVCMDMAGGSGGTDQLTEIPGEIVRTAYWRLDQMDVTLSGEVTFTLPIGEKQSAEYRRSLYDGETQAYRLPDRGVVTFSMDTGDMVSRVVSLHPDEKTVTPDVTVSVSEAAFTPLMTYITLNLEANPDSLAAYKAEHGEGYVDENGSLLWAYSGVDVYGAWISSLELVDGAGQRVFPENSGLNGCSSTWAEFTYPYMDPEKLPEQLWLAPVHAGTADMSQAIRVK